MSEGLTKLDESTSEALAATVSISKRHPLISWLLAILLAVLGVYLSIIEYAGLEWLTRSGCLIAVLGVWSGLGGIIQERILIGRLNFQHRITLARAKRKLRRLKDQVRIWKAKYKVLKMTLKKKQKKYFKPLDYSLAFLRFRCL